MQDRTSHFNRRQLLQAAALIALSASAGLPGLSGCSGMPKYDSMSAAPNQTLALVNGRLIDVTTGIVHTDKTVILRNGRIQDIVDTLRPPPEGALVYDLKHQYVIPGLIDAHVHTTLTSEAHLSLFDLPASYAQFQRNFYQQLTHGVTTVRDMGAMPKLLHRALTWIERGKLPGPRVVYCNAFTNVYRGHPDIGPSDLSPFATLVEPLIGNPSLWFKDTHELRERLKSNSEGASFIKLTMDPFSVLCGKGEIPVYKEEHLQTIMAFAEKANLPVAAHIHSKFGFDRALDYGINSMEHSIGDATITNEEARLMADKNIAIVPTLIIAQTLSASEAYKTLPSKYSTDFISREMDIRQHYLETGWEGDAEATIHRANRASLDNFLKYGCDQLFQKGKLAARPELYFDILLYGPENLLKMKQAGALIGCGTDSGVPFMYPGSLWREMEILSRIGFSNLDILQCATINNARILRLEDQIGSIEKGKIADLTVLAANPLEDIRACRTPALVIREGRIYNVAKGRSGL